MKQDNNADSKTPLYMGELFDPSVRDAIRADPRQFAFDQGMIAAADSSVEIKLVVCEAGQMVIPMQRYIPDMDALDDDQLARIAGGVGVGTAGSVGSSGTAGTISTIGSSFSSASTASTAATIGSAGSG